ncbi:MAG: ABC transporter ATP-binding protein [Clostridiales bacterium]|nr:ABC transporter ATP-binding protein [Clostridiales bacterium]
MNLEIHNLSFAYGNHPVLEDVSFGLDKGDFLSVLGPNGVGKSTLFRCILGRLNDYSGSITSDGDDLRTLPRREAARRLAYIPQIHTPTFSYTVLDTVLMGTARQLSPFAQPGRAQSEKAMQALERVGAAHLAQRDFTRLSGGEQQLVLVARAIAQQADILIMDEPTSALDYGNQLRVLQLVRELAGEGYGVLLSTHNPQHALTFATRTLALCGGRVAALGRPEDVLTPELVSQLYGVDVMFAETPAGRVLVPMMAGDIV